MKRIRGNVELMFQKKQVERNRIGENEESWTDLFSCRGFLDLSNGDSHHTNYNAKLQESTHVFICDWSEVQNHISTIEQCRAVDENQNVYEIKLADNPMGLSYHAEIMLKYVGRLRP